MKPAGLKSVRRPSDLEEQQRRKKTDSEEKLPDKNRVHSFILDLELGTEERRKTVRKDSLSKEKERKEKEKERGGGPDERLKLKLKTESRKSGDADEKDTAKGAADEKKGSKVKPDRKSSVSSREGKPSVSEAADEGNLKKGKTAVNEKEKPKPSGKGDSKLLRRLDSTGSSEERSEVETGSEVSRKKDKQPKEIPKRSKSHPEAKAGEKPKVRTDRKDSSADKTHPQKPGSETEGPKVKSPTEKHKSKSQNPKSEKKIEAKTKPGTAEQKKDDKKTSEEKTKVAKKTTEKKVQKDSDRKSGGKENPPETVSSSTALPDDPYAALSDVTPESEDEEAVLKEPRPLSAEADALLSLMDVRTSQQETEADRKMKEAALTLLSMDPDITRSSDLTAAGSQTLAVGIEDTGSVKTESAAAEPMETEALGSQEVTSEVNT